MKDLRAARKDLDGQIERLDAEIAQYRTKVELLEAQKVELKRRRNDFSPMAQLPPEVIIRIFSFYLKPISSRELAEFGGYIPTPKFVADKDLEEAAAYAATHRRLLLPDVIALCHVSHGWSLLALDHRELWSCIQIQIRTSPEVLKLMLRNAGERTIKFDIVGTKLKGNLVPNPHDFPVFKHARALIQVGVARLKSLGIYCFDFRVRDILRGRAEQLESLTIIKGTIGPPALLTPEAIGDNGILEGGTPNLGSLELSSVIISWTSLLLASPRLTVVTLRDAPPPTPDSMAALFAFLRRSPQLTTLVLIMPSPNDHEDAEFLLSHTPDRTPIQLPSLTTLKLNCNHHGPIAAILSLIRMAKDMKSLSLESRNPDRDFADFLIDFCTLGQSLDELILPEEISVEPDCIQCWKVNRRGLQAEGESSPQRTPKDATKDAWMRLSLRSSSANEQGIGPTFQRFPWSLDNLRAITIHGPSLLDTAWPTLASLTCLQVIRIGSGHSDPFLRALARDSEASGPMATSASPTGPSGPNAPSTRSCAPYPDEQDIPFPSLKEVWFSDVSSRLQHNWLSSSIHKALFQSIVNALSSREGAAPLEILGFAQCGSANEAVVRSPAELDILSTVTNMVAWDGRVYTLRPGISGHPSLPSLNKDLTEIVF